jgi:prevent-host-death family protein
VPETVNIHFAKTNLSRLIERAERGEEITIARAGKPVAILTAVRPAQRRKLGALRDEFDFPPAMFSPELDREIAADFENGPILPNEGSH